MFGRDKRNTDTQIPYEIYQTVQEPTNRRRQWFIRLAAALVAVTLLVFGGTALYHKLRSNADNKKSGTSQQQGAGQASQQPQNDQTPPPDAVRQDPQQNNVSPNTGSDAQPATMSQSNSSNDSTVRKPE